MRRPNFLRVTTALALVAGTTVAVSGAAPTDGAELGPDDFQVSQSADAPGGTAIAYNATDDEYLVVWAEVDGSLESRVYGRIIDGAGTGVTDDFLIAQIGSGDPTTGVIEPDVAWNSTDNEYVVVMAGDDAVDSGGLIVTTFEIYAQRVTAAGAPTGLLVEISDMGADDADGNYDAGDPAIAYNAEANEYLVVWDGDDDTPPLVNGENEIFGQRLSNTLVEIGGDFRISDMGADGDGAADAFAPAVAFLSSTYLVVWHGDDDGSTFEIYGQLLDAENMSEIGADTLISTDGANDEAYDPAIAADPTSNTAVVVWEHDTGGDDFEIAGAVLTTSGTGFTVGTNVTDLSGTGGTAFVPFSPSVAHQPTTDTFSIVWAGDHSTLGSDNDLEIFHTAVDATLTTVEPVEVVSTMTGPGSTGHPDVAAGPGAQSGIVWVGDDTGDGNTEVFGQFVVPATDLEISKVLLSGPTVAAGGAVQYEITYRNNGSIAADAVITDLPPAGITFDGYTSTGPTLTQRAGANYTWDVTIAAGETGTITIDGTAPSTQDTYVNTATIATGTGYVDDDVSNNSADAAVFVDAPPTVTIEQAAGQADPTNGTTVNFTATFSETVTGFDETDVDVSGTATTGPVAVTPVSGTVYTVAVTGITGDGMVIVEIPAGAATDATDNPNLASTSADNSVTVDLTAPTSQIVQAVGQLDPTNGSTVEFTTTFSEPVSGFDAADVDLSTSTTPGTLSAVVAGGPAEYTVTVSGYTGDGDVVAIVPDDAATDAAGNTSLAVPSPDSTVTVDQTAPTVTIDQAVGQADPAGTSPIEFDVVFSEPVTGFDGSDVDLSGDAGATTAIVTPVSSTEYTVAVSGMSSDGEVVADVGAGAATDAAGNTSAASTSTDNSVTYDATAPTVTVEQAATQADPTAGTTAVFDIEFSEIVTGFDVSDIAVGGTATVGPVGLVQDSLVGYTATVSGITADGTVIMSIPAGAAADSAGNATLASTSTDNTVTVDTTAPTSQIEQAAGQPDPTNAEPVDFTVTFSEPVTGFDAADVDLSASTAPGTLTAVVTGGPTVYGVAVTGFTDEGTIVAAVADGAAADLAGNTSLALASTDASVEIDLTSPSVTIVQTDGQADPTNESPVSYTVEFSAAVTGFAADGVVVGGTAGATTVEVTAVSATEYLVEISGMANDGTITAAVAVDAAFDSAGNGNLASTSTDDLIVYDTTAPILSVPGAAVEAFTDPGQPGAIVDFVVTATDPVAGTASGDRLLEAAADIVIGCDPASGSFFSIGETTVSCDATDAAGNTASDTFVVEVIDDEDPVLSAAPNRTFTLSSGSSGPVTYDAPTATDNSGEATVVCTPASGSTLSIGARTITCTAIDPSGNTATTSFVITVDTPSGTIPATGGGAGMVPLAVATLLAGLALLSTKRRRRA